MCELTEFSVISCSCQGQCYSPKYATVYSQKLQVLVVVIQPPPGSCVCVCVQGFSKYFPLPRFLLQVSRDFKSICSCISIGIVLFYIISWLIGGGDLKCFIHIQTLFCVMTKYHTIFQFVSVTDFFGECTFEKPMTRSADISYSYTCYRAKKLLTKSGKNVTLRW
jgi:hypothetical protein